MNTDRLVMRLLLLTCFSCGIFTLMSVFFEKEMPRYGVYEIMLIICIVTITLGSCALLLLF